MSLRSCLDLAAGHLAILLLERVAPLIQKFDCALRTACAGDCEFLSALLVVGHEKLLYLAKESFTHIVDGVQMGVALLDLRLPGYEGSFAGARTPMTFLPS